MKIGTKSVLYGAHCFLLHWFFVALGWWKVYGGRRIEIGSRWRTVTDDVGFTYRAETRVYASLWHPALWLAFFVHDLGYLGKPNMDGPEGELHPMLGAKILRWWFGEPWGHFVMYHSRFLAKQHGVRPSALCIADKLAIALEPWWFYLPRVNLTGEVKEYMAKSSAMNATGNKYSGMNLTVSSQRAWNRDMCNYIRRWVEEHKDGREDTWTPNTKEAVSETGVWK
ncbi:MAG TPA: hypothetical protein VL333_13145 [Candidatus Saccharimonadales bacterium]|jgi:hypothetical protein|nr:hypothetical protein [Candidatus Saccharimonadales bacterium]